MRVKVINKRPASVLQKKRVCAYARVSTDSRRQEDSLENQMETYERLITGNPEYEFIGVFADQGISGYCENRPQFQRMMEKARAGEIDLIITKSISRFARNTVTVLKFARELKELGVGIFFEEQNINTLSGDGEMMLAVLASFAQEESRSMSENNKWSIRKKFERGEVMITTSRFLGYDKNEYGDLIVNRKEAEIVSLTFDLYLLNVGSSRIGELLDYLGVKTVTGTTWESGTINGMLCNEKYKGDFHLQKYYTPENKRNHTRKNNGEVQSYYISENHEPIVSPEVWEKVQEVREQRKRDRNIGQDSTMKFQNRYPLSGMLICPYCGKTLRRRQVYKKKIQWLCSTYIEKGVKACKGIRIDDAELQGLNIAEAEEILEICSKTYAKAEKEGKLDDLEMIRDLIKELGEKGFTAVDSENQVNMTEYEKLIQFSEKAEAKKNGRMTVVEVAKGGSCIIRNMETHDGIVNMIRSYCIYENGKLKQSSEDIYRTESWEYTEDGHLMFSGRLAFEGSYEVTRNEIMEYMAYRVLSLDETCRELNRKYILPIGYERNNMFLTDWSEEEFAELDFYDMFDLFYQENHTANGEFTFGNAMGTSAVYLISKEKFEPVIKSKFKISSEVLQSKTVYYPCEEVYEYKPRGLEETEYPEYPYPEVIGYVNNDDGTLTLKVQAVFPYRGVSKAYIHEVTVRDTKDGGIQYVGNRIIEPINNPEIRWHVPRLTRTEWEELYGDN